MHSPTVNRHCPLISGSQMFQAELWLQWITFYSIIFLHQGRSQSQLVSSCNALSMSQIVVSCRRSQQDCHHCHPHEEHCSIPSPVVTLIHKYWQSQADSPPPLSLSHFLFFSRCVNYLAFYLQYKVNGTGGKKTLNEELTCYWREKKS